MLDSRINWVLLSNAALGSFLAGTASRIFAVSLPTVASSLETTIVGISWAVIAYQISQISLSLVFGRIGDIYGRQTLFGLGLVVSAIGALLCGLSQNVTQLILFRLFQGVGASMTQSQARALAMDSLPKESSGKAQGFMTTAFHTGVLIGPSAGGFIIEYISWRAVFFFLVPIALAGAVLSLFHRSKVDTSTHAKSNTSQPAVDYLGAVLLVGATVGLIAVVDHRIMEAAGRQMQVGLIAGFVVFFLAFLYRESSTSSPILDLSLFRIRHVFDQQFKPASGRRGTGHDRLRLAVLSSGHSPPLAVVHGSIVRQRTGFYRDPFAGGWMGHGQSRDRDCRPRLEYLFWWRQLF